MKMQLMNAMGYQGIFEAAQFRLTTSGGVMLWKLNAAFPSVIWKIYDWYLMPNAGYYFMQKSCDPLHESMPVEVSIPARLDGPSPVIQVSGWNVDTTRLPTGQ